MGQFVHTQTADDTSNCHGWVFTGGRSWVGNDEVDRILADNGYEAVDDPRPDDLVIYRHDSSVKHTAVVRAVVPNESVLVEGKWGWMGLFIHPVDQSPYGVEFTYYRSARSGHLLQGLAVNVSVTTRQRFR